MYDVNVLGTLRVTQALLPALEASGAGTIVVMSSTAGLIVYEGGGGYAAAKHAQTALAETLRLELCGRPIRVIEIDPGMVAHRRVRAGPLRRRRASRRPRSTPGWPSRWSPRTSPTASPGAPPGRTTSTSTGWWSARSPRPPSTRCTGSPGDRCVRRSGGGRPAAPPTPTGCAGWTTGSSRTCGDLLRAAADPLVVDLGYGATPVTAVELRARLAPRSAPDVRVVGLEIDPVRVAAAGRAADPPGLTFRRGGFELAGLRPGAGPGHERAAPVRRVRGGRAWRDDDRGARARRRARRGHLRRAGPARLLAAV